MRHPLTAVLLVGLVTSFGCHRDADEQPEAKQADPAVVTRTSEGDPLIRIGPEVQTRIGLEMASVQPGSLQPEIIAYGHLEEDPSQTFVVRSPVAGTLMSSRGASWPSVGEAVAAGQGLGVIEPRIAPAERIAFTTQLSTARSETESAAAAEQTARAGYERARLLNADNKNVSDRVVEEAGSRLESERARLKSARTTLATLENSLRTSGPAAVSLAADTGGTVVETMARPGESVEAGLPLLRIARLDRLIARVDLPVGQVLPANARIARVVAAGHEHEVVTADRIAATPVMDPKSPGESYLFRLREGRFGLRPGLAISAYLPLPGTSRHGFKIPTSAVVRLSGKAYVYVQTAPDRFVRREVTIESPADSGYFITGRLAAGDRIVVTGAQTLLSEEFKPESVQED